MKEIIIFIVALIAILAGFYNNVISFDLATFFVFVAIIGTLILRDRKNVKFEGLVFIRRTKKGRDFIDKTASNHRSFWNTLGKIGVIVAIPVLVLGSLFLISQAASVATGAAGKEGGVRLLLPGPVSSPTSLPGVFVVPWWIWVIGIAAVIIPHEFMHGIMCRLDKIRIKAVGWILLIIIPGAFVEPDEAQLKKAKRSTKLKVYAAGSFANLLVAMILLVILSAYFAVSFAPAGVFVLANNNTPASQAGITGTITEIAGHPVTSPEQIKAILANYKPGDTINVKTLEGDLLVPQFQPSLDFFSPKPVVMTNTTIEKTYSMTLASNPDTGGAYMGVQSIYHSYSFHGGNFESYRIITVLLLWIYIFSLGIGIVNILPIKPLDGGLVFEEIAGKFTKNTKLIVRIVSGIMIFVLLFNLLGPIFI